jgi:hypothetical protein
VLRARNEDHGFLAPNGKIYNGRSILPIDDKEIAGKIVVGLKELDMYSHIVGTAKSPECKILVDVLQECGVTKELSCKYSIIIFHNYEDRAKLDQVLLEITGVDFGAPSLPFPEGT